jgi:hypothetical protein
VTMRYNRRYSKPSVRTITVKFDGKCACCAAPIKAGEIADFYPAGTIAGVNEGPHCSHRRARRQFGPLHG